MSPHTNLPIDKSSTLPLYRQIVLGMEQAIRCGELAAGSWLESEADLASRHALSLPTVRKAIDELVRSGLLMRRPGIGTRVVGPSVRRDLELSSLHDDLLRSGRKPATKVVSFEHTPADEHVRARLHLPDRACVYHFVRVRTAEGQPLALMENWLRDDVAEIDAAALEESGLYGILRRCGVAFRVAHQRIGADLADERHARLLRVSSGTALVTVERTAIDDIGRHVETGRHSYPADDYSLDMTLVQH